MQPLFDTTTNTFTTSYPYSTHRSKSDDSTFNGLQLNANGIDNKLTELGVVKENHEDKVVVIQESKLTPKSKNPCIENYSTVRKDRPHGQGGGLLIFIHRSVTFSKQPSSAEPLYDPHLEQLAIEAEIGNTKLIISNIYIPHSQLMQQWVSIFYRTPSDDKGQPYPW